MGHIGEGVRPRTRVLLGVCAGLAALMALGVVIALYARAIVQRDAALLSVRNSYAIMLDARELDATVARMDALLSRYIVNGQQSYGVRYSDELIRAEVLFETLMNRTRKKAEQHRLLARLRGVLDQRFTESNAIARLAAQQQAQDSFHRHFQTGIGAGKRAKPPPPMEDIERPLDQIIANEQTTLIGESRLIAHRTTQSNRYARLLAALGVFLAIGGLLLGFSAYHASRLREDEERRREALELKVAERTEALTEANRRLTAEMEERASAEAQLRRVQKMEAIGQLTGGIAHDFNNMLAVVIGGLDLARRRVGTLMPDVARYLDQALDGAGRATALTKQLLVFARGEALVPRLLDANLLITDIVSLLDRTLGEDVRLDFRSHADLWPIYVDGHQLENALLNLAVNARDAMPGGGQLTISAENVQLSLPDIEGLAPGDYVAIRVADTGTGMNAATLEQVFEPFFTTKPIGKGSGLGLSQAFGFARQSGGSIDIRSTLGVGTIVSLYLPRRTGLPETQRPHHRDAEHIRRPRNQSLVVLVIEDDSRVLTATTDALTELGHVPLSCPDPLQAEDILAQHPQIDLVLCDVLMPGISGPDLITRLRPRHPHLPVLFVTGYAGAGDAANFGDAEVMRKPFTIAGLADALDRTLNKRRPR